MDRGFYSAVSAMMSGNKKLNDTANNIANINTTGYKKDTSVIEEFSDIIINKVNENKNVGYLTNQVFIHDTYTSFKDGSIYKTAISTDYALTGDGFFKIEKDGQYLYTRDGSFHRDINGFLVTSDGGYVLNKNEERIKAQLDKDYSEEILVVSFDNNKTLKKLDNGFYVNAFNLSNETRNFEGTLRQGYLEMSNVDAADELTDLIKTQRYFQFNQKALQTYDEIMAKISEF